MHSRVRQLQIWDSTKKLSENAGWGRYATNHSYSREILLAILQYNVHHCPARRAINIIESSRDCTVRQQLQYFQFWCVRSTTVVRDDFRKTHNLWSNRQARLSEQHSFMSVPTRVICSVHCSRSRADRGRQRAVVLFHNVLSSIFILWYIKSAWSLL